MVAAHSGPPDGLPWWAVVAQVPPAAVASRSALRKQSKAAVRQSAEPPVVERPVPLEPPIEQEVAAQEP
jgi:hypothetical protein